MCVFLCVSFVYTKCTISIQILENKGNANEIQGKHIFLNKTNIETLEQVPRARIGLRCVPSGVGSHAVQY